VRYLLDTCAISELAKAAPNAGVVKWLEERDEESIFLSVLTLGEIQKGVAKLPSGKRKDAIQRWLDVELRPRFSERLLAIDEEVALTWGLIQGEAERRGKPIPTIDGLIGATAIAKNLIVVTRDDRDIRQTGARVLNPWA
jgi:predicted nucleic acid-binding protein